MNGLHRWILVFLYLLTAISTIYLVVEGWEYYSLDQTQRPHSELHENWKPGGFLGHTLGVIGSFLMLLMLLYLLRKRMKSLQNLGNLRDWLNYHIWMGIAGPILVIFHTSFKFGGIVAVSFWSMIAVALSGVLGRYLYIQIPRSKQGIELNRYEIETRKDRLFKQLETMNVSQTMIEKLKSTGSNNVTESHLNNLLSIIKVDFTNRSLIRQVKKELLSESKIGKNQVNETVRLLAESLKLSSKLVYLDSARAILHYWHVVHRPFAMIMFLIMFVHIIVAALFGYKWIF